MSKKPQKVDLSNFGGEKDVDINQVFVEINGQDISKLKKMVRIYYGKAWFNKKDNYFTVVFDKKMVSGNLVKRPFIYIARDKIVEFGYNRLTIQKLDKIAGNMPKTVFIFSTSGPEVNNGYINIKYKFPYFLDYRFLTI